LNRRPGDYDLIIPRKFLLSFNRISRARDEKFFVIFKIAASPQQLILRGHRRIFAETKMPKDTSTASVSEKADITPVTPY